MTPLTTHTEGGELPVALTIAGSDSGGGAGIQADLLAFAACGAHGTSAITCLTAQNPDGVSGLFPVAPDFVLEQARQVARFFRLRAIKSGMLLNREIILAVCEFLREQRTAADAPPFVLDPVMVSTSGAVLLEPDALATLVEKLFPFATLITPNLDEAALLLGWRVTTPENMRDAACELRKKFGCAVLLKGGHLASDELCDILISHDGAEQIFVARRRAATDTHGSGCTLAAAIAAFLAQGRAVPDAVAVAHAYLQRGIHAPIRLSGRDFIARWR